MKGFLNEPFVDRIFGFSTNSATRNDDWLKFSLNQTNRQSKREKVQKRAETSWETS